jgi:pilus assembly protein CpaE
MAMAEAKTARPAEARRAAPPEARGARLPFLAFVADSGSEDALRGGLADLLVDIQIRQGGMRAALKALETEESPRVVLVDVSGVSDPVAALDTLAGFCAPDVTVLVVGERTDIEFYREVTRALGVDEYVAKPLTREKVSSLVKPHLTGEQVAQAAGRGGRVVAVCGARGGAGATTIAVNLALQLAETAHTHVALLDMHLRGGHAAMMLGQRPGIGLRHALENPQVVDSLLLERVAIPVGDRLRVFAAEEPFDADPRPSAEGVGRLLELLRERFNVIIVDLRMPPSLPERQVLAVARQTLVVFAPEMGSLRDAEQTRRVINSLSGAGRALTVLNRADAVGALKPAIISEALGGRPDVTIPDLPRRVPRAANLGRPALHESSALRRALAPLTQEISGQRLRREGGLLGRLFRR